MDWFTARKMPTIVRRLRRPSWHQDSYVEIRLNGRGTIEKKFVQGDGPWPGMAECGVGPSQEDLLAEDWQVISEEFKIDV